MPDREKVIKGLEEVDAYFHRMTEVCYRGDEATFCDLKEKVADAITLLKEQEATKWISTAERLPKSNPEDLEYPTVIIALEDGTVELGCFYESTKEWGAGENFDRLRKPVAWMPLPEAP